LRSLHVTGTCAMAINLLRLYYVERSIHDAQDKNRRPS
jgi:hypothetical protein